MEEREESLDDTYVDKNLTRLLLVGRARYRERGARLAVLFKGRRPEEGSIHRRQREKGKRNPKEGLIESNEENKKKKKEISRFGA